MHFFLSAADADDAGLVFDQQADGLAAQMPPFGEFAQAVMLFKGGVERRRKLGRRLAMRMRFLDTPS